MPHRAAGPLPEWLTITAAPAPDGATAIDGRACRTRSGLFAEFARALRFPDHFGRNWDALADCLRDVAEVSAPMAVSHAEDFLTDAPELAAVLLEVIDTITAAGAPGVTLTLHVPPDGLGHLTAVAAALLPNH